MNIRDNAALKAAFDEDVITLGGPSAVANKTRVDQARISRYASISDQNITTHVPVDVLADVSKELVRRGAVPKTLQELVDQLGFKLVPRESAETHGDNLIRHLADTTMAQAKLSTTIADALADGRIDPREKQAIDAAAAEEEKELAELRNDLQPASVTPIRGAA